jgi:polar amino acid transport system substrate-binding protein
VAVRGWDDVRKLGPDGTVLLIHGYGMLEKMQKIDGLRFDAHARDARSNLMKLVIGRGRFHMHRDPGLRTEVARAGVQNQVRVLPEPMERADFHMVIAKSVGPEVRVKVQCAIAYLARSGEPARLFRKWGDA